MKPKYFLFFLFSFYILNSTFSIATVRYVSKTGSSTFPYTSWQTAADSIQKCINICSFGDTVYVANGVYIEKIVMRHGLTLIGGGMDSCVIDTRTIALPPDYYTLTMRDECSIEGFHIITLSNQGGTVGILCFPGPSDSLYFQGSIINNKISKAGRGIYTSNAFLTIKDNIIEDVGEGIRVSALDTSVLDSIYNNYLFQIKSMGISTNLGCRAIIFNNYIQLGSSNLPSGIGIASAGLSDVYNNLILGFENTTAIRGISLNAYPNNILNNLIYIIPKQSDNIGIRSPGNVRNNQVIGGDYGYYSPNGTNSVYYNNAWKSDVNYYGFNPDSTNLSINPMFVNEDSIDFHLQKYSPLIDAGDPNILDKDGSRSDIGLFGGPYGEKYTYRDLAPKPPSNLTAVMDSGLVKLRWNKNSESDFYRYRVYRDTVPDFMYDTTKIIAVIPDTIYYDDPPQKYISGNYYYKITALDNTQHQSAPSEEVHVNITGIPEGPPIVIEHFRLLNNYPNPFNSSTIIPYRLKEGGYVKLYVYDVKGELVSVLVNGYQNAGYYEVRFSPTNNERNQGKFGEEYWTGYNDDIASGMYIYQLMVRGDGDIPVFTGMGKMILLK